ncbi:MAG: hypothetical protein NTU47_15520 [Ignavibacteriales bacterium]|nr:hypothetical protein [Ignavibacteriales bacterium]
MGSSPILGTSKKAGSRLKADPPMAESPALGQSVSQEITRGGIMSDPERSEGESKDPILGTNQEIPSELLSTS